MAYILAREIEEARLQVGILVNTFKNNFATFKEPKYNETQLRNDFLNPFLLSLGWDVFNEDRKTHYLRDVLQEESIPVEGTTAKKSPDYTLRISGSRQYFLEAKKPSVEIQSSIPSAFQTRRYGWNAGLKISVLSNFEYLVIFDCRHKPDLAHNERVARYRIFHYEEYVEKFDEIYNLLSNESSHSGSIENIFEGSSIQLETFDDLFLSQLSEWRFQVASSILNHITISTNDLNLITQKIINRIIFIRICEDREIEKYETLKNISTYSELKKLFQFADKRYNSGLFELIEDSITKDDLFEDDFIVSIFESLYYPLSPFDFSVVDSTILSQIYERFLGYKVEIINDKLVIVEQHEVSASNGVVTTPEVIVSKMIQESLNSKNFTDITKIRVADISCGSGIFLIKAYEALLNMRLEQLLTQEEFHSNELMKIANDSYILSLYGKTLILQQCIFGVDINPYAVEVVVFGLLVKLLENETMESIEYYLKTHHKKVLPALCGNIKIGNSLVDDTFFNFDQEAIDNLELINRVKPFNWTEEFPSIFENGGFDIIIGNPPYVRIQNLIKYSPEEVSFFQSKKYGYVTGRKNSIDKYYLFFEKALSLLNENGSLCYITPHKFTILNGGAPLRSLILENSTLAKIIHFGTTQVFKDHTTYTAIFHLLKQYNDCNLSYKRLDGVSPEILDNNDDYYSFPQHYFTSEPWIFLSPETRAIFTTITENSCVELNTLCNIVVGVQTSADKIYIFTPTNEDKNFFYFNESDRVEKDICRPCIYDLSFKSYDSVEPNCYMIFPYKTADGFANVLQEDELSALYPNAWRYLNNHKTALSKRNLNGHKPKWYQFGRSQSLTKFDDAEKLIWPVLSTENNYTLDDKNILFTGGGNGPYYALTSNSSLSLHYILAWLNHPLIESMVKSRASDFRGDYYSHGKQFLENLPILIPKSADETKIYEDIIELVSLLLKKKNSLKTVSVSKRGALLLQVKLLNKKIVTNVNSLIGITNEDIQTVENDDAYN